MMFGGKSMGRGGGGGGGGGGGSLLRSVGRAVTRANFAGGALQEPNNISSSSSSNANSHSGPPRHVNKPASGTGTAASNVSRLSSPFASCNVPVSPSVTWPPRCDDLGRVSVGDGFIDDYCVLGPVPSEDEVHNAVSALQQVFCPDSYYNLVRDKFANELDNDEERKVASPPDFVHHVSPGGSEMDWIEPSLCMCSSKTLQCGGPERVYDAFRLLRTEPLVQKMVKSLSSDEAVWNAVLNNEAVRELRESFSAEDGGIRSEDESNEDSDEEETSVVKWIFDGARAKIMEVVEKITKLANDLIRLLEDEKTATAAGTSGGADPFKEKLRTSFMLSIMVLLVVVVARAHKA